MEIKTSSTGTLFMSVQELADVCHGLANEAGWWIDADTGSDVRNWPRKYLQLWIATKLMLTVSEVSEAMEGLRKNLQDDHLPHRKMFDVELADALIRICDLAGGLGVDLAGAVVDKLAYNASRADHKLENRLKENGKSF